MRTGHVPWWRSLFERTDEALRAQLWAGEWIYAQQAQLAKLTGAPWCHFCWKSCGSPEWAEVTSISMKNARVEDVEEC